jgi:hypothetical protein
MPWNAERKRYRPGIVVMGLLTLLEGKDETTMRAIQSAFAGSSKAFHSVLFELNESRNLGGFQSERVSSYIKWRLSNELAIPTGLPKRYSIDLASNVFTVFRKY